MTILEFLFFAEGRISRRILWRRLFLPVAVLMPIALYISFVFVSANFGLGGIQAESSSFVFFFALIAWPIVAVSVKRLHDRNKSGWWMLVALVPYIGWIWYVVDVALLDGTHGSNDFGPDPLERQPVH